MEWRGIPYPETVERVVTNANLVIDKLPKVYIDTGDNLWPILGTIGSSLIAGAIPAIIAWLAIKSNQKTFEADRVVQLEIAKTNFNAQVISASRQVWINKFTDVITEYVSLTEQVIQAKYAVKISEAKQRFYTDKYPREILASNKNLLSMFEDANNELHKNISHYSSVLQDMSALKARAELMMNPTENFCIEIKKHICEIYTRANVMPDYPKIDLPDILGKNNNQSNLLICEVQKYLKLEWERTKRGE